MSNPERLTFHLPQLPGSKPEELRVMPTSLGDEFMDAHSVAPRPHDVAAAIVARSAAWFKEFAEALGEAIPKDTVSIFYLAPAILKVGEATGIEMRSLRTQLEQERAAHGETRTKLIAANKTLTEMKGDGNQFQTSYSDLESELHQYDDLAEEHGGLRDQAYKFISQSMREHFASRSMLRQALMRFANLANYHGWPRFRYEPDRSDDAEFCRSLGEAADHIAEVLSKTKNDTNSNALIDKYRRKIRRQRKELRRLNRKRQDPVRTETVPEIWQTLLRGYESAIKHMVRTRGRP